MFSADIVAQIKEKKTGLKELQKYVNVFLAKNNVFLKILNMMRLKENKINFNNSAAKIAAEEKNYIDFYMPFYKYIFRGWKLSSHLSQINDTLYQWTFLEVVSKKGSLYWKFVVGYWM